MNSTRTRGTRRARRTSPEASRAEVADLKAKLDEQVKNLTDSEEWRAMLRAAVGIGRYSFRNILLILLQRPDATHVAGYGDWQKRGRQVRKGERGIRILAPMTLRRRGEDSEEGEQDDSQPFVIFRPVSVFDISQTDPLPGHPDPADIPAYAPLSGAAPEGLWEALEAYVTACGYTVERGDCGSAEGWTDPETRTVRVGGTAQDAAAAKVLAHEAAHIACGHIDAAPGEYRRHRGRMETEAESVAYIVAAAYGLETSTQSARYVAGWASRANTDNPAAVLQETGERVITTARAMLDALAGQ
ncbi:ssDNA-binding domain-containing protein [Streptomyces tricolor]|uniref:SsDNA-binding domain-containing protein n=1 Tax=Streptomyces tricolor TaxID=68277 RepID=A0ABS9JKD5_9ACTN|nr:ArdC-like ssDNA-binding domain-containing protein [Streptomyces tricolor]MCG0066017.1 ssDNA-binding domain-containing protein [Streptomyces tricolor]